MAVKVDELPPVRTAGAAATVGYPAAKSSTRERNSLRIGNVFALL